MQRNLVKVRHGVWVDMVNLPKPFNCKESQTGRRCTPTFEGFSFKQRGTPCRVHTSHVHFAQVNSSSRLSRTNHKIPFKKKIKVSNFELNIRAEQLVSYKSSMGQTSPPFLWTTCLPVDLHFPKYNCNPPFPTAEM